MGVVQLERRLAPDDRSGGQLGLEQGHAGTQVRSEPLLLPGSHARDEVGIFRQVRVGVAHDLHDRLDHAGADEPGRPEQAGPQNGAADDPAQDVPAVLVRREHTVRDHEGHGPGMVRQHPQGHVRLGVVAVRSARQSLGPGHQRAQYVGLPDRARALQEGEDPLEPGARVNPGFGQRHQFAGGLAVVGLEDEVPQLDVPFVAASDRAATDPPLRATVEMDLRARPARTCVAHFPEVVFLGALDARPGDADHLGPQVGGLVVSGVDGDPELFRRRNRAPRSAVPTPTRWRHA